MAFSPYIIQKELFWCEYRNASADWMIPHRIIPPLLSHKKLGVGVWQSIIHAHSESLFLSHSRTRMQTHTLSLAHAHTLARTPCGVFRDHATASTWDPHSSSKQRYGWWPPYGTPPLIIGESEDKTRRSKRPTMRPHGTRDTATHGPARG